MMAHSLTGRDNYADTSNTLAHWRDQRDRRFWWIACFEPLFNYPMAKCVMDDFGDLVRVSEVV